MTDTPNPSVEEAFDAAPVTPEPTVEAPAPVTEPVDPAEPGPKQPEGEQVDYKEKFSASSREAQRLLEESKEKDAEIERLKALAGERDPAEPATPSTSLYPGFEELSEDEQNNLRAFTETVQRSTMAEVNKDPAIAFARETYNKGKFNDAFEAVVAKFPALRESEAEFKAKFYNPKNVPDNIETILTDVAKVHLFDKAHDLGAAEERERQGRIDTERANGGQPPVHTASRSLEEWQRMQQENPAEFARHSKEYQADLEAGKLGE